MERSNPLETGICYHIFSRSISNFQIFNSRSDFLRMLGLFSYYQIQNPPSKYSIFMKSQLVQKLGFQKSFNYLTKDQDKIVEIIAYCLMPTHIHLILKQLEDVGISQYMRKILNSYSCYFNLTHHRNGPLWESRFKNITLKTDEQLLHLTRYIHLNPTSASLVEKPEQWEYSSYYEYVGKNTSTPLSNFRCILDIDPIGYKKFVEDRIAYQRELSKIKPLLLD